eukprot:sb/3462106/
MTQCQLILAKALQVGCWVHLHAVHNCPDILLSLLTAIRSARVVNSNFRLWLSCEPVANFPSAVLQSCVKICTDSPRVTEGQSSFLKDGMVRSLSWIGHDLLTAGTRNDWLPLLHNLCLIFNLFQLRGKLAPNGWNYNWTSSELWESFRVVALEFTEDLPGEGHSPVPTSQAAHGQSKAVSWTSLRYLLGEVIYGAQVHDPLDKQVINAMLDHFITPAACKKDYEIPRTKWKLPGYCFQPSRSNQISLIASQIENNPPPESYETVLMHSPIPPHCYSICSGGAILIPEGWNGQVSLLDWTRSSYCRQSATLLPSHGSKSFLSPGTRNDWLPLLHNLCLIFNLFQLRGKLAPNGWNYNWTSSELWESFRVVALEFTEDLPGEGHSPVPTSQAAHGQSKAVSWTSLRYLLGEVIYGAQVHDPLDKQVINAMLDHFITPAACKKDYEIPRTKWKLPGYCFQPSRSNQISLIASQIENNPPPESYETVLMHSCTDTSSANLHLDPYFFNQIAIMYDVENKEADVEPSTPTGGAAPAAAIGTRSSANSAVKSRDRSPISNKILNKDIDIIETANIILQKLPKGWHKDYVTERLKKLGSSVPFTYLMNNEMTAMQAALEEIRSTLLAIKNSVEQPTIHSPVVVSVAHDLLFGRVPRYWQSLVGSLTPNPSSTLAWVGDVVQRCSHLERALQYFKGRERVPCLWISVFSDPEALLGTVMHEAVQSFDGGAQNFEEFNFQTEITNRDKDHIREAPHEGMFLYGIFLYGASWERTINESPQMQDMSPKCKFAQLPVVHVTAGFSQTDRTHCLFQCPVYNTRTMDGAPLFSLG